MITSQCKSWLFFGLDFRLSARFTFRLKSKTNRLYICDKYVVFIAIILAFAVAIILTLILILILIALPSHMRSHCHRIQINFTKLN